VKLYVLAVGGGALIQGTIVPVLGSWTVVPDLPVVLVVLLAMRRGPEVGCVIGFALGVAQDVIGGGPLGLHALSKSVVGFVAGDLPRWCLVTNPVVPVVAAVAATVADASLRFAVLQLYQYPASFGELFGSVILPQAAYNGVLAAIAVALPPVRTRA
jgi:rod shape-determining protein MreD